jgi:hypothetical protein
VADTKALFLKALTPIVVTELGMFMKFKYEQPSKTPLSKVVTEVPIVTELNVEQFLKAPDEIVVTELGIVTDVKLEQLSKIELLIIVTEVPIVTDVKLEQLWKTLPPKEVTELGISTNDNFVPRKAPKPIDVNALGRSAFTKLMQLRKQSLLIIRTELGNVTDVKRPEPSKAY